jgi:hypothetical protein
LLPLWDGFESNYDERVWQDLDDVFAGIPVLVKRYLLGSEAPEMVKDGLDMCSQLGKARTRQRRYVRLAPSNGSA